MQTWEYHYYMWDGVQGAFELANRLGADGWDLTHIYTQPNTGQPVFVFKRPLS
jgi:hypothetical protein